MFVRNGTESGPSKILAFQSNVTQYNVVLNILITRDICINTLFCLKRGKHPIKVKTPLFQVGLSNSKILAMTYFPGTKGPSIFGAGTFYF